MKHKGRISLFPAVRCSLFAVDCRAQRGITLIDTIVGVALMLVVFVGIAAAFQLSVDVVSNNKARSGAIALADQRLEYVRSLSYASVGTVGGVPAGSIPQSESVSLNGIAYTRRTVVEYVDDPKDGLGAQDTDGITADYKAVKVDVAWTSRSGTRHVELVTRVSPATGMEQNPCSGKCGTLVVSVVNSVSQPVSGASVTIVNSSVNPAISISTFTNTTGTVTLLAAPVSSSYAITATNPGYTSASLSALSVTNNNTTTSTLKIDLFSSMTVITDLYGSGTNVTTVPFTMIGSTYGYNATSGGGGSATTTISSLHWDTYTFSVAQSTGYDLAYTCSPQPISLAAGISTTTTFYLSPHSSNTLSVKVTASSGGALIAGASVHLFKTGYDSTQLTDSCGQTFFSSLSSGKYSVSITASGYSTYSSSNLNISGPTQLSVSI